MAMKAHNEVAPAPTGDVPQVDGTGAVTSTVSKKRSAGFWAVLFMVIGNQFGGLSTVWSLGAAQGLKKLLLAHALIGFMYVLLSFCFAELTSMVPFAGGSFGFCRAALGPFWGFLVGASEVVENALKVVVCVYLIGTACSATFKTDQQFEPFWHLICYILLYGIHLRGGMLLWFSIIVLGVFSIAIVMIFCIGNSKDIDVHKYGQLDASSFTGNTDSYLESFVLPIWIYIGLEIVPQTCERVKNVNRNLPWALVIGNMFTYLFSFWVLIVVTCSYPGMANSSMWIANAFPFTFGFDHLFNTHFKMYGPAFAILTSFASALTFMWGCGHQLASLAQSGLVPSIFAKTFGENEAPIVALTVTTIAQYAICVGLQQGNATRGINACYSAMMIGASMVYVGMFASFIVFRVRFDGMKRHWISPLGIPGAVIGIGLALLLVVIELVIIADANPLIVYFVYMGVAILYYIFYASHHQYFSKEEQKQFMKAYILNANKGRKTTGGHHKAPHTPLQRLIDTVWEPLAQWFGLSSSLFGNTTHHNTTTAASPSLMTHATKQTHVSKINTVAPAPSSAPAPAPLLVAPVGASVPPMGMASANSNKAPVEEVRSTELTSMAHGKSAKVVSTRQAMTTTSTKTNNLRASWAAASGSTKVSWSGKAMTMTESKKFLEVLMSAPEDVANQLVESLPNQFVSLGIDEAAMASTKMEAGDEVLLPEIVEGITDDDDDDDDDNDNNVAQQQPK